MAYQTETPAAWPAGVYQIAVTDPVLGGSDGAPNVMGAALAKRALYQRMRNVTAWDATLAAAYGYPAGACVRHGVTTWRAIVDTDVEPGTDPLQWERWGYSETELAAVLAGLLPYGAPVVCSNVGPDVAANKSKIHKSAMGEYWMWLGDAWRVVAGRYTSAAYIASNAIPANTVTAICSLGAARDGRAVVRGIFSALNSSGAVIEAISHIRRVRAGVTTLLADSVGMGLTNAVNQYVHARAYTVTDVLAGDTYYVLGLVNSAVAAHPVNQSSIHMEYLQ